MNSRERVFAALNHQQPDYVPLDLGSSAVTGISASAVYKLRVALGLHKKGERIKVWEPYQMLGEVAPDLQEAMGVDCTMLCAPKTFFGFENTGWKPWSLFDGTPVWVPSGFNTEPERNGDILMYPEGDESVPPSGRMPSGGHYFDSIKRQLPVDDACLRVEDNLEEFGRMSDADLAFFEQEADRLYRNTSLAIVANIGGTGFGDIALVPAPWLKHPKGIRDVTEWYISTVTRRAFIQEVFHRQAEIALENLELFRQAAGDCVSVIFMSGTDFGTQRAQFMSNDAYRELYQPYHKRLNDWVHAHTGWKTFIHTCGAIEPLIDDFVNSGFDILNPVQVSAAGMNAANLKARYGEKIVFWGGGIDTQRTLSFGTPDEVRDEVRQRVATLNKGGGFVFNTVHNIQATTPQENLVAMLDALKDLRSA